MTAQEELWRVVNIWLNKLSKFVNVLFVFVYAKAKLILVKFFDGKFNKVLTENTWIFAIRFAEFCKSTENSHKNSQACTSPDSPLKTIT